MYCIKLLVMVSELETVCTEHCSQTARLFNIITDHTSHIPCLVWDCLDQGESHNFPPSVLDHPPAWEQPLNLTA